MAFGGVATIQQVSDRIFRVTGLTLAQGASGTISTPGSTGNVKLTGDSKVWGAFKLQGAIAVAMADSVQVVINHSADVAAAIPYTITKTGTTNADFLITLKNASGATDGPATEIYIIFH